MPVSRAPGPPVPVLQGLSSLAPACGLRGPSFRMEKPPASPAPATLSFGRPWRPCGLEPTIASAAGRNRRRAPMPAGPPGRRVVAGSAVPFASAASPAPSRPREAVAALWKRPGAIPALPYAANRVASGAATPLGPRSALAPFFHGVLGQCSCSWLLPVKSLSSFG